MPKFTYNDIVRVRPDSESTSRWDRAWIIGIFEDRPGPYFDKFPEGVVYTIEFEDGSSIEVHEGNLKPDPSMRIKTKMKAMVNLIDIVPNEMAFIYKPRKGAKLA